MKYVHISILFISLMMVSACSSIPELSKYASNEIIIAPGPEDIVIDSISGNTTRLLVSCGSRREGESIEMNGIYSFDFESKEVIELKRKNEASNIEFHPHGFDLAFIDGQAYLYVINHEDKIGKQSILVYQVFADYLIFVRQIVHPSLISPNDIFVNNDGSFFISNDAGKRGNKWELLLGQKKGSIIYFSVDLSPTIVDNHLGYPNGLLFDGKYLYATTVSEKKLYRYEKTKNGFENKTCLAEKLKGGDNLNPYQGGVLIPTHPNFIAFLRHKNDSSIHSPSVIYHYKFGDKKAQVFYSDDGSRISAASTALVYKNKLYLSQIFDDCILEVDLTQ